MYIHVFKFPGSPPYPCSLAWGQTPNQQTPSSGPLLPLAPAKAGGSKKKNTPMTLKSFYSCNHRLPSTWIRTVTPAPACLPPQLPKLPAGRQTGKLPSYCQGGQGRERTGSERFDATHNHTQGLNQGGRDSERQRYGRRKEHSHKPPKTDIGQCPHSSDMPRFTLSLFRYTTLGASDTPRFTGILQTHRYTQNTHRDSTKFPAYVTQNIHIPRLTGTNAVHTQTIPRPTDSYAQTPRPQDRHTFNTEIHGYMCPESSAHTAPRFPHARPAD